MKQCFDQMLADPAQRLATQTRLRAIRRRSSLAVKRFGFDRRTTSWHSMGMKGLLDLLWPPTGRPCCPLPLAVTDRRLDRKVWEGLFELSFRQASHHSHGDTVALADTTRRSPRNSGFITFERRFEADSLHHANLLAELSLAAIARGLGCLREFNQAMSATRRDAQFPS